MEKRMVGVFCLITLLMTTAIFRVYTINNSDYLSMAASTQGRYRLEVTDNRGAIYDRNFTALVNGEYKYVASVLPTPQSAAVLMDWAEEEERELLLERLSATTPFVMELDTNSLYADGIDIFRVPLRYSQQQVAPHIIGYLSGDGKDGVTGIEKAYDELLRERGGSVTVSYQMDAAGRTLQGGGTEIRRTNENSKGGVVLTLDKDIQLLTQEALASGARQGAAVVMEIHTGNIIAMASIPAFDQNDIAASLERDDAPFFNRATAGYNIGSVYKVIVSTAALESGISQYQTYECQGYIDVGGQIFRCNNNAVHGTVDMKRALEVSCNTYFIDLMQQMGPGYTLSLSEAMGIGGAVELAPGMNTQPGNLPGSAEVATPAGLANFSFGQGSSLASPLQMAQAISVIANGGMSVTPRLVEGTTLDGETLDERYPIYASSQIVSTRTSGTVSELMVAVIEEGSGKPAKPVIGGAGGKTSSAQTGQMDEETGKEIVHAWFAGFYPAENPRYAIVVFCEGGESGERVAAPIFKQIVDGIGAKEYVA